MGRLFWKIFFAFWLAQLAAGAGTGTVVWLRHRALAEPAPHFHEAPFLEDARAVLRVGGVATLRALLQEREARSAPPVYALDEGGRELLGRALPAAPPPEAPGELVMADDGHAYRLLHVHGGERFGAGPPPPGGPPPSPWMLAGAGLAASLLFSAWLAWYLSRPIRTLRGAFESLAAGRLDARIGPAMGRRRDELADLGRDFDHMAGRVAALVDAQRRLLHDVSHELRSPLARLQVAVGLARQRPERQAASLDRIEREAERLDGLVGELLALSRLEAGVAGGPSKLVELAGILADIVEDARFEAAAKGVRVECRLSGALAVRGEAELLYRALENVVRNAVQHSPAGGVVRIEGGPDGAGMLWLAVCDQGPGVPQGQLEAIFAPFFRGAGRVGGVGLGLAIARRAVEAHGGRALARNRAEGGLCVELRLPAA